ncbi:MAG: hypothetical protein HQL22_11595, partial [Candidatus Omnitrophica bacterium]|nr:hypothetical protein [Candidatus Omnitrophota bacterium]
MLKKTLLILAIIAVILSAGIFYVNKVLLPVQVKGLVLKAAEDALNRKVSFDSLQFNLINGFVLNNFTIYSKENPAEVFIHLDRASAQVLFPALLQKKIILPSVRIDNLSARVIRFNAHDWNFSDLLAPKPGVPAAAPAPTAKPGQAPDAPMDVVISGLSINNARIKVTDLVGGDNFTEMIDPINIKGSLSLTGSIHLAGDIRIPSTKGQLNFDASVGMKDRNIKASVNLENIITEKYLRFVPEGITIPLKTLTIAKTNAVIQIVNGDISVTTSALLNNIDAEPVPGIHARGSLELDKISLTLNKAGINVKGSIALPDAAIDLNNGQRFSAAIKATGTTFSLKDNNWNLATDAEIKGLNALINDGQKASGDISLAKLSASQTGTKISAKADISLKNISADANGISVKTALSAPGAAVELNQGVIDIKARPIFNTLAVSLPQGMSFNGAPAIAIHAVIPPAGQGELTYEGSVQLNNGTLKGLPMIGEASHITGTVQVSTDEALIKNISLSILGADINAGGTIHHLTDPTLDITAQAKGIDLALAEKVIPEIIKENGLTLSGNVDVSAEVKGKIATLATKGVKATATLTKINIDSSKMKQAVNNLSGTIIFDAPTLTWKNLVLDYQKKTYTLNGYLEDFANPLVATQIKAENMNIDAEIKKTDDLITVKSMTTTWFDTSVTAAGKIRIPAGKTPTIDITTTTRISLKDIPKMAPDYAKQVEPLKLAGMLTITSHVKGNPVDWPHLESTVKIETPVLNVMGYTIENLIIDATQLDGQLQPLEIKAKLYEGDLDIIGSVDLVKPNFPFDGSIKLERTNLEALKKDTPLKDQRLSGMLSVSGSLKANATGAKSLNGTLSTQVTEGYLAGSDSILNGPILGILSSTFKGGNLSITDETGTLAITDGKVETNDLTLKGPSLSLIAEGWIDLNDMTLDMNVTPRAEATAIAGGTSEQAIISAINPTEGLINIHVTGPVTKPKIDHNISAPTVIKKTLQNTVGGLLKMF